MRDNLSLGEIRDANLARLPEFKNSRGRTVHGPDDPPYRLSQWSNAVAGEVGALCNLVKKVEREDFNLVEVQRALARECADIILYLDLFAYAAGIELGEAVREKFNLVSDRIDSEVRL